MSPRAHLVLRTHNRRACLNVLWLMADDGWRRSMIVVRTLVSAGELSLSCARLLAG